MNSHRELSKLGLFQTFDFKFSGFEALSLGHFLKSPCDGMTVRTPHPTTTTTSTTTTRPVLPPRPFRHNFTEIYFWWFFSSENFLICHLYRSNGSS
jgi:hypothetical protein